MARSSQDSPRPATIPNVDTQFSSPSPTTQPPYHILVRRRMVVYISFWSLLLDASVATTSSIVLYDTMSKYSISLQIVTVKNVSFNNGKVCDFLQSKTKLP